MLRCPRSEDVKSIPDGIKLSTAHSNKMVSSGDISVKRIKVDFSVNPGFFSASEAQLILK